MEAQLELSEGELFISDLGEKQDVILGESPFKLGRYAVMKNAKSIGQLQVLEISSELEYLFSKYHLKKENVGRIKTKWN